MSAPTLATPYHLVSATVGAVRRIGANVRRVTFTGPELAAARSGGRDQRLKLILPLPGLGYAALPSGPDWYTRWRDLPVDLRNPVRTYTVRAARTDPAEFDVDFVVHGPVGPGSRWALNARAGDEVVLFAPNRDHDGPCGGIDFLPPRRTGRYLLAGDETALPAVASIVESLPASAVGTAVLELADPSDALSLGRSPDGMDVRIVLRPGGAPHGAALTPAVERAAAAILRCSHATGCAGSGCSTTAVSRVESVDVGNVDVENVGAENGDVDTDLLWEAPRGRHGGPALESTPLYAWLAGETGVIRDLRRHLVGHCGVDRRAVAFMGYWRKGRAEGW